MYIRRVFACLCVLTLLFALCACTTAPTDTTASTTTATPSRPSDTTPSITTPGVTTAPAEPEGSTVRYGTPDIDGVLDAEYDVSFRYTELPLVNLNYTASPDLAEQYMANTYGTAYYLYDDDYLYVCAVIHDETICSRGEDWRKTEIWPWNDDGAEIYLWFSDEICMAIHADAAGIRAVVDEHIWGDNHNSSKKYHDLPEEDWCAVIDEHAQTYTIEMRIPLPEDVGAGSYIGTLLEIDDRWDVGAGSEKLIGALFAMPRFPGAQNFQVMLSKER